MIKTDFNQCRIISDVLSGQTTADEQTFASLAVLEQRLERLRKFDEIFAGVKFSSAVRKLKEQKTPAAI